MFFAGCNVKSDRHGRVNNCYDNRMGFWRTVSSYVWWTHVRGSIHYDVMVTFLLLFIFLSPYKINFRDKPAALPPHPNQITAYSDPRGGEVYEVPAAALAADVRDGHDGTALQAGLQRSVEPVAGLVSVVRYEAVHDERGRLQAYRVWISRPPRARK